MKCRVKGEAIFTFQLRLMHLYICMILLHVLKSFISCKVDKTLLVELIFKSSPECTDVALVIWKTLTKLLSCKMCPSFLLPNIYFGVISTHAEVE